MYICGMAVIVCAHMHAAHVSDSSRRCCSIASQPTSLMLIYTGGTPTSMGTWTSTASTPGTADWIGMRKDDDGDDDDDDDSEVEDHNNDWLRSFQPWLTGWPVK